MKGGNAVRKQILLAIAIALSFGAYAATGFCQAAAEYSATTAGAASASASGGSALGSALNSAAGNVSERVGESSRLAPQPRRPVRRAGRVVAVRPLPANAQAMPSSRQMRLSFNRRDAALAAKGTTGGLPNCPPSTAAGSTGNKTADASANSACKPALEAAYPSTLKLSFPDK
jgi:hypothetical protein